MLRPVRKEPTYEEMMKCTIPEGKSGRWGVERFTVDKTGADWERVRATVRGDGRFVPEGTYTRLIMKSGGWSGAMMTDTPDEIRDHWRPFLQAKGLCLVTGLGLGCVVQAMLESQKPDGSFWVDKVIVIEIEEDIINLVGTHLKARYGDRLEIRHADALEYVPPKGERYDVVWHDIWPTICVTNLKTMGKLHRKYGRRCNWQSSWQRERLKLMKQREMRQSSSWY